MKKFYISMWSRRYLLLVIYAFFNMDNQGWGTREGPKLPAAVDEAKVIKDKLHLDFTILIVSMTMSEEIFCFKFYLPVDSNGTARQREGVGNEQVVENSRQQ